MTLNEKTKEYQKILIDEYRKEHMEETENLTDEEVALMNPITNHEFTILLGNELKHINEEIVDLMQDIKACEERIKTPGVHYQEITECRGDIVYDQRKLQELREKFDNLKNVLLERDNENERSR